jgi:hypothetical protein
MEQELYAFWSYDRYPYCLWGKIDKFKGDSVYIDSYLAWFKPFKILEGEKAKNTISELSRLIDLKKIESYELQVKYDDALKALLPDVFKK